jgi:AcrR family transcriptional regulator
MPSEARAEQGRQRSASATRARILTTATEFFYSQGIRSTSADRIIEAVGITKVTFYRHFRSKSDLVVAYLEEQAVNDRGWMEASRRSGDAIASLRAVATGIGSASCLPGFRGCPFINAAAEFSDPQDPVRSVVDAHRKWTRDLFASIATDAGVRDVDSIANQLVILRDGAMVNGYLSDPETLAASLGAAFESIIDHAAVGSVA